MASLATTANLIKKRYLPLIKSRQTILLALTGAAGYLCQPPAAVDWARFFSLMGSLLVTISGCTALNMLFDRDIDCKMERTRHRPLASGSVNTYSAVYFGGGLLSIGLLWAASLSIPCFLVILAGAGLNVVVYTVWLKRRSAWSILWGGLAGGMPILAGRVLAIGRVDWLGLLLALLIVCWIPSHNLTLTMLYSADYQRAGIPTFLNTYGVSVTHLLVAISAVVLSGLTLFVLNQLSLPTTIFWLFFGLSLGLIGLAVYSWRRPAMKILAILYKYSSAYLLISTLLLVLSGT